jgi:hypothetical protein
MPRARRSDLLTAKQARFVQEYLKDLNASDAAARAGYSPRSARKIGSQLLALPHVRAEVSRLEGLQLAKAGITAESVLEQIRRVAFFDVATIYENINVFETHPCKCVSCEKWDLADSLAKGSTSHGPRPHDLITLSVTKKRLKHPADWPAEARAALQGYDTVVRNLTAGDGLVDTVLKVKMESKLQALEMLAKHLGLLTEKQDIQQTLTIQWLPPEPRPTTETIEQGPPRAALTGQLAHEPSTDQMGSAPAPAGPQHRTVPRIFPETGEGPSSAVVGAVFSGGRGVPSSSVEPTEDELMAGSGISRKAQERMFPELRKPKPKV